MGIKFQVIIDLEVDDESYVFEAMGSKSSDLLEEIKRVFHDLDDITIDDIEVRLED